ncbi:MAG: ABC transporter ATP-binding protein [Archangium sp.]|nr:ABC transporter ATP-binding protein [Archangium sp.]MDP3151322.1 ABC transporter ATP-binding protein [Archangium sp.]MDP3571621.1 ABC transporter ATP-binding protein [Archangium sp.]
MISIQNVSKAFGAVQALDAVSLELPPGSRVALVGTNGSGKTTLLRAVCGLLRVQGRITLFGADVAKEPEVALRSLASMPQIAPPLDAPVVELVRAFCVLRSRNPLAVATRARRLGLDLELVAKTRVRDLSGGMKQKLLAALALTAEAPVLICDEPTANLDPAARRVFFDEVLARPGNSILVLCSHRVDEVQHLVERVIQLDEGHVVADAPLSQTLAKLRGFRVDLSFREALAPTELATLVARGFTASSPTRFHGEFSEVDKVEVVSRVVATWGPRLLDLSLQDSDALNQNAKVLPLRAVNS